MKNYLVKSLFKIKDPDWEVHVRHEQDMYNKYVEVNNLSLKSFEDNLEGKWEYKFITGEFETIHEGLHHTFHELYKLWKSAPCNILYTDPDTLCINPLDIWGKFDKFMMFNYTDPKQYTAENKYNLAFQHFFNAGVRYFPSTMDQRVWDTGLVMAESWDFKDYDSEQIILNLMLWMQNIDLKDATRPDIAYQAFGANLEEMDQWNNYSLVDSAIIHLHGSRNIDAKLAQMKSLIELFK